MMFQYGGTIGPSRYPTFKLDEESFQKKMLPRPVKLSRPEQIGHIIMSNCGWLNELCKDVESLTINYILEHEEQLTVPHPVIGTQSTVPLIDIVKFSKVHIPPCLRICKTMFTQMILVGSFNTKSGYIPPHYDDDDYITALVSLGNTTNLRGGDTFYSEIRKDGTLSISKRIPYRNGNVQIGQFDQVLHGSFHWTNGERGVINLSIQKKILRHFFQYRNKYY